MMLRALLALLAGYLLGSIPSADLAARTKGKRIFEVGSSNMGAMNTARNLGYGLGVVVLVADIGKGALASVVGLALARVSGEAVSDASLFLLIPPLLAGVGAVMGHAWSCLVRFRGGKGLATVLGTALPLYPLAGLSALALLIALLVLLRRVALASICVGLIYPWLVSLALWWQGTPFDALIAAFLAAAVIAGMVIYKHLPEARRERQDKQSAPGA